MSSMEGIKEAICFTGLINNLKLLHDIITTFCYSQSAIHLTKNQMYHERTKYIDVKLHFIQESIARGILL